MLSQKPCYLLELTLAGKKDNTDVEETFKDISLEDLLLTKPEVRRVYANKPTSSAPQSSSDGGTSADRELCSTKLRALNLSRRGLTGSLPDAIGGWKEIRELKLGNNKLSGVVPSTIGQLVKIKVLSIEKCGLTGRQHLQHRACRTLIH